MGLTRLKSARFITEGQKLVLVIIYCIIRVACRVRSCVLCEINANFQFRAISAMACHNLQSILITSSYTSFCCKVMRGFTFHTKWKIFVKEKEMPVKFCGINKTF
jgi:predicted membrane channel-forming protein YqfA (hemolysin III family)